MDSSKHSPAEFWKRFQKKGKPVPKFSFKAESDADKWMGHFEKLLNVPRSDGDVDCHMFDIHFADLSSAFAFTLMKFVLLLCR